MRTIHILLVENNEGGILFTKEAPEDAKACIKLSVVKDGKEAIDFTAQQSKYADAGKPDLLLLDVNLPKKNGREVLKYIKGSEPLRDIPGIMLTTSSSKKDVNLSYNNHANCYITKPAEVNDLIGMITAMENSWLSIVSLPTKKTVLNDKR